MDTIELTLKLTPKDPWAGILIAELSELGFDSFVESKDGIQAYGPANLKVKEVLDQTSLKDAEGVQYSFEEKVIPHQNWNAKWEEGFDPVYVDELVTIVAPFHKDAVVKGMKVVIQPQMSFGTGHHQTTWLMSKELFSFENMPEHVLDMGTGTGVLAVIAEKLGAKKILAVDIEEWSAENAQENVETNSCNNIIVKCGDIDVIDSDGFGLIIANINKNILKMHMEAYANLLTPGGVLLLSGFFHSDVDEMTKFTQQFGLQFEKFESKDEWAMMRLTKTN